MFVRLLVASQPSKKHTAVHIGFNLLKVKQVLKNTFLYLDVTTGMLL